MCRRLVGVSVLAVAAAAVWLSPLGRYLDFARLLELRDLLKRYVASRYALSVFVFLSVYIVTVSLSVPAGTVLTLTGGMLFGPLPATLYANVGATIGAYLVFLASRHLIGVAVQARFAKELTRFNSELARNGRNYLLTVRLIPFFPFFLVNLLSGLTRVPDVTFLWTTALGIIPMGYFYASLGDIGSTFATGGILAPGPLLVRLALALAALVPVIVKKFRSKRKRADEGAVPPGRSEAQRPGG
jgi:uncharacterized membrane protein YdjX (TVP38/TMEM64 family)